MRKSTNTDNLSSEAYNKRKGGSKENENRKKQREIINLAALFEVEKYMGSFSSLHFGKHSYWPSLSCGFILG